MNDFNSGENGLQTLTNKEFSLLRDCIREKLGIKMPDSKKAVLEARLQKRLRVTGISNFSDYCHFLFSDKAGLERVNFIDAVTTHKTFFFREPEHLDFLCQTSLPNLYPAGFQAMGQVLDIWSAGCSSGEEPYSIAIQLEEFRARYPDFNLEYAILATDVSPQMVKKAKTAVYSHKELRDVANDRIVNYFLKSRDQTRAVKKIVPEIRQRMRFGALNLNHPFRFDKKLDVIFCRNVMIYFDELTKSKVVKGFADNLAIGGYLFIGSSENLRQMDRRLIPVGASVYQRQ